MQSSGNKQEFRFNFKDDIPLGISFLFNPSSLERRQLESVKIREKFQDRVPFQLVIRKRLQLPKTHSLYIYFENNKLNAQEKTMAKIFEENKDQDGFLYCKYTSENFTG